MAAASDHAAAFRAVRGKKLGLFVGEKENKTALAAMEDQADKQADGMSKEEKRALAIAKLAKVSMQS